MASTNNADVSVRFGAEWIGQKAIGDAKKGVAGFSKEVKLLANSFVALKILQFGKESLAAFTADQKAALALTNTMKNLNMVMTGVAAEGWIQRLSLASGIVSEKLSPAFQDLIRTTGDYAKSQKLLTTAIDVSRSSSVDLETVAYDLSQAYIGNTKGLKKYALGLTNAQIAAMSFEEIVAKLNGSFAGSNARYLESYAGKMDQLTVGADKAKEIIGQGLMSALDKLAGGANGSGVTALVNLMIKLSEWTAKFISGIGSLAGAIALLFHGKFGEAFNMFQQGTYGPSYKGAIPSISAMVQQDEQKKAAAKILKDQKLITDEKKKQLALDKAKAALAKAQANFDITKINLAAALKGKISEDEKNRVLALQAIENGNGEEALKYIAKIDAAREAAAQAELARQRMSYEDAMAKIKALNAAIESRQQYLLTVGMGAAAPATASSGGVAGYSAGGGSAYELPTNPYGSSYYGATGRDPMPITVVLDSNVVGNAVRDVFLGDSLSGSQSAINRNVGTFSV
jgi:hypothetical protein